MRRRQVLGGVVAGAGGEEDVAAAAVVADAGVPAAVAGLGQRAQHLLPVFNGETGHQLSFRSEQRSQMPTGRNGRPTPSSLPQTRQRSSVTPSGKVRSVGSVGSGAARIAAS